MTNCILCTHIEVELLENIKTKEIAKLYRSRANVNVDKLFNTDSIGIYKCKHCELKFYDPAPAGNGYFYDKLQDYKGYYLEEKPEYLEAAKYINSNDNLLEIGCGAGWFSKYISPKTYIGLEFSENAITQSVSKGLHVIQEDLEYHSNNNLEKYDVVCYFQVLEHVENPRKFINESLKCLKKGGKLIFAVPSEDSFLKDVVNMYLNMPPHHVSRWSDHTFDTIANEFSLRKINVFHEPLHKSHEYFYAKVHVFNKIRSFFGLSFKSIDISPIGTFLYGISAIIAKVLEKSLIGKPPLPMGQSVLVIYEKLN